MICMFLKYFYFLELLLELIILTLWLLLNISLNEIPKKIKVYNSTGILVAQEKTIQELDFRNYANGMYFVKIELDGNSETKVQKIIVKH